MEFINRNRVAIAIVIVILAIIGVIWINQRHNDTQKKEDAKASQQQADEKKKSERKAAEEKKQAEATKDYNYTAAAGDSYTALARKSVQSYAKANNVTLSKAQIVAAETILTQKSGAPLLDINDKVTLKNTDLKNTVASVQKLSKSQLALWQAYVPYVVF